MTASEIMLSSGSRQFWLNSKKFICDLFVCSLGYENRATALLDREILSAGQAIAFSFYGEQKFSFLENERFLKSVGAQIVSNDEKSIRKSIRTAIANLYSQKCAKIALAIDVSSMNRTMIASSLDEILCHVELLSELRIFYVPASFEEPTLQFPKIAQVGPVIPLLSGFDADPSLPLALVVGLGFEFGIAIGVTHQLEPQTTICFRAVGHDARYEAAVKRANSDFDFSPFPVNITDYSLLEPVLAARHIDDIVAGILPTSRLILVPMGPKILAAYFILSAIKNWGQVAVWRVTHGSGNKDASPAEEFIEATVNLKEFGTSTRKLDNY
jgi:hypothetical protein